MPVGIISGRNERDARLLVGSERFLSQAGRGDGDPDSTAGRSVRKAFRTGRRGFEKARHVRDGPSRHSSADAGTIGS